MMIWNLRIRKKTNAGMVAFPVLKSSYVGSYGGNTKNGGEK
jgi:hypothetical protein